MGSVLDKNSSSVRKRIEEHSFSDEEGDEYEASAFNGFGDYFRRKKLKLQNLDADMRSNSEKPQIFKGVVAHVTGYTQPPLHILHREIVQHGGGFLQYLDSKTMATHIIASTLPPKKTVDFTRYRIVKPAWIVDSVKAGRILPWPEYRVLDEGPRQKVLQFDNSKGLSQASPRVKQGYREQTEGSYYTAQFKAANLSSQVLSQAVEKLEESGDSPSVLLSDRTTEESPGNTRTHLERAETDPGVRESATFTTPKMDVNEHPGAVPAPDPLSDARVDPQDTTAQAQQQIPDPEKTLTSEEHNAWLLSDPRMRKSSTANPEFLKQYYSESRLHHLSTWKAELKSKMQQLASEKDLSGTKVKRNPGVRRYIMHVDFDSFFCAVSIKKNPEFIDKPAVVAHGNGTGSEIASCNYPARKFGVKNGMWMKRALELCADLKVLPYDFPAYEETSRLFYECILRVGGRVQSVSVDEVLLDATDMVLSQSGSQGVGLSEGNVRREQEKADQMATSLRDAIRSATGCNVSVGVGGNILQAKVALRRAKPAGQFQLKPDDVLQVLGDLRVDELPGVAYSISGKLEEVGVKFVKDIRDVSRERLTSVLGPKTSERLRDYSRGIDRVEVGEQAPRKSVSAEVNWGIRFLNQPEAEEFVVNLCKELEKRLVNEHVRGKLLTMKIMRRSLDAPLDPAKHLGHGKCDVFSKSIAFGVATHNAEAVGKEAITILRSYKFSPGDLRGLGVQMTKLEAIKSNSTNSEGSQRKLAFAPFAGPSPGRKPAQPESIIDEADRRGSGSRGSAKKSMARDPIEEDTVTPVKPSVHRAMALAQAGEEDAQARTPLNIGGTQFIMPSNADPATLAELPSDIRKQLMGQRSRVDNKTRSETKLNSPRSESPAVDDLIPSQVDAEVFNALPDDMKAEVLASYRRKSTPTPVVSQPQSPKPETRFKKQPTPKKRGAPRGLRFKAERQRDALIGLVQTSFKPARREATPTEPDEIEDLDLEFLAELPEDVRKEIIADHRRRRLARRSGLNAPEAPHGAASNHVAADMAGQTKIHFPAPPPKVSFAGSGVLSTSDTKDMLDAWHMETRRDGPHRRDVGVFEEFLVRVIQDERDMEKVVKLVKWLEVLVEQDGTESATGKGQAVWRNALASIKGAVQQAMEERGLPRLRI